MFGRALPITVLSLAIVSVGCGKAVVAGLGPPDKANDDAGEVTADANAVSDAGTQTRDAGMISPSDSGPGGLEGGVPDGGEMNFPDSGIDPFDAGDDDGGIITPEDAGTPDAGVPDAGTPDAGTPDGGTPDGGAPECMTDMDCRGIGPRDFCELTTNTCVECLTSANCPFNGVCDTAHGYICRNPCFNGFCAPGQECDTTINACVDCLTDMDCNNGERCHPVQRECVDCLVNADCALEPGQPLCDTDNECVGCLQDTDCAVGELCYSYQGNFCAPATGRTICTPCLGDAECGAAADLCIGYAGAGGLFDRSCSPACMVEADCPRGWDCVSVRQGANRVCRPRYSMQTPTCTAERNLGAACRASSTSLDPGCGLPAVQDARCISTSPTGSQCVIWCSSNDECPTGTTCQGSGGNQRYCL